MARSRQRLRLRLAANQLDMAGGTKNVLAYDHYLRGQTLQKSADPADWEKPLRSFEQAVALDPEFGQAAAKLAWMYYSARSVKSKQSALKVNGDEAGLEGRAFFEKAAKHPSATYYQLLSENLLYQQKTDEAVAAAERAIALDPSDPWGHEEMGFALILNGRPKTAASTSIPPIGSTRAPIRCGATSLPPWRSSRWSGTKPPPRCSRRSTT